MGIERNRNEGKRMRTKVETRIIKMRKRIRDRIRNEDTGMKITSIHCWNY